MKLVVIPSDPIEAYEKQGFYFLKEYYNPQGYFDEVYAISPYETTNRYAYGMTIRKVSEKQFRNTVKEIRPDVIRAYGGYWPCNLACYNRVKDIPVVVSVHDANPNHLGWSVRYADMVICMSQIVARLVKKYGVAESRIKIIPNRIDTDVFCPKSNPDFFNILNSSYPPGKHILHIGRKTYEKNLDTLIRAMALLPQEYSVIFIGGGDNAEYKNLALEYNVADRCFWRESVPNAELPYWHAWSDCFCTPSRQEGFGLVFIEAATCGNAIITSDIAPMNEYLTHNLNAFLVKDYENQHELAAAIKYVCEDEKYKELISSEAVNLSKKFERDLIDREEVSLYKEVLTYKVRNISFLEAKFDRHLYRRFLKLKNLLVTNKNI
jgi:glycosyltransferase involved in cell wall biosynthesis